MTAQVHQFPTDIDRLTTLAKEIQQELATASQNALESAIRIGERLIEAKRLVGHGNFIPWLEQNFHTNRQQAQKYMSAAKHADRLRANVHSEWTFALDMIPALLALPDDPEDAKEAMQKLAERKAVKRQLPSAPLQKVLDEIDRRTATGEDVSYTALKEATGASASVVGKATAIKDAAGPTPLPELSLTAQQKLEMHDRKREAEFNYRVNQAAQKLFIEIHLPRLEEKFNELKRMLSWPQYSVMTKAEYNQIRFCLHEDTRHSRTQEQLNAACHILNKYKLKLINDAEERENALRQLRSNLPTREEMLARLKAKRS